VGSLVNIVILGTRKSPRTTARSWARSNVRENTSQTFLCLGRYYWTTEGAQRYSSDFDTAGVGRFGQGANKHLASWFGLQNSKPTPHRKQKKSDSARDTFLGSRRNQTSSQVEITLSRLLKLQGRRPIAPLCPKVLAPRSPPTTGRWPGCMEEIPGTTHGS
jgi:hypothetical protein